MVYDLEIYLGGGEFHTARDVQGEAPRLGETYEVPRSTQKKFVGVYDVVRVIRKGDVHSFPQGVKINDRKSLVVLANKREHI